MSIKTVIFDIGGVLTINTWNSYLHELAGSEEKLEKLIKVLFYSGIWQEMEKGNLTEEETLNGFLEKEPELENEIRTFWRDGGGKLRQYEFTKPMIKDLKEKGFQVLYLSNWGAHMRKEAAKAMDFLPMTDGGVFSYEEGLLKPDPAIYERILDRYNLVAEECVFLDDTLVNVEAARKIGMYGIHVVDQEKAHEELYHLLGENR